MFEPRFTAVRRRMSAPRPLERRMSKFLRQPPSIRAAASVIVTATTLVVLGSGVLMRLLDHEEYPSVWRAFWWALQTVTTVGYGDVTPQARAGRIIGAFVMLQGIAFLAILTAAITSTFVARVEHDRQKEEAAGEQERLDEIAERLGRIEAALRELDRR
jgi:voltage-gated potassium channel